MWIGDFPLFLCCIIFSLKQWTFFDFEGSKFCICTGISVDNIEIFKLLLKRAHTDLESFLLLTPPHQQWDWGCTRSWVGTQLIPAERDIPDHVELYTVYKAVWMRRRKGKACGMMMFVFPGWCCAQWSSAVLEMAENMPAIGTGEWIPQFSLLVCVAFTSPNKLPLSQLFITIIFALPILSHISMWGEWARGCVGFRCHLGSNHNTIVKRGKLLCHGLS